MTGFWIVLLILLAASAAIVGATAHFAYNKVWAFVAGLVCLMGSAFLMWMTWATVYKNDRWATCHVTEKDRGGDNGSYRVYTSDCGQLSNEDSLLRLKFNSADIWQDIPNEGAVKLRIAGSRIPFFSQFPNVFDVEKADS